MNLSFTHHSVFPKSKDIKPIDVFVYELNMLNNTRKLIDETISTTEANHNALIESFLLHTRSLIDFFEKNKRYPDDIVISNFSDKDGNPLRQINLNIDESTKIALSKYLAHMTTLRMTDEVTWRPDLICKELNKAAYLFIEECNEDSFRSAGQKPEILAELDRLINT